MLIPETNKTNAVVGNAMFVRDGAERQSFFSVTQNLLISLKFGWLHISSLFSQRQARLRARWRANTFR